MSSGGGGNGSAAADVAAESASPSDPGLALPPDARGPELATVAPTTIAPVNDVQVIPPGSVIPGSAPLARSVEMVELRASRGILTDPRSIAEYERSCPGLGIKICDHFFAQAAKEQDHRHAMEKIAMDSEHEQSIRALIQGDRAQKLGLLVVSMGLGIALFLGFKEQYTLCGTTVGVVLSSTVVSFIYGRKKQAEEVIASKEAELPEAQATSVARSELPPKQ